MSIIDIIILVIIGLFVWKGVKLGLIEAIGGIIGLFIGAYAAGRYFLQVAEVIKPFLLNSEVFSRIVGFILVFLLVNRAVAIIFWIIDKVFHVIAVIPFLKTFNSLFGGIFGLLEGLIFIAVIVFFLSRSPFGGALQVKMEQSRFASMIGMASNVVKPFIPESAQNWSLDIPALPNLPNL